MTDTDTLTDNSMSNNTMTNANTMTDTDTMTDNSMSNNTMTHSNSRDSSNTIISDLRDVSGDIIGMIVDMLDAAVGKVDAVVSLPSSSSIIRLLLVEPCSGHIISHSVLVVVGGDLP